MSTSQSLPAWKEEINAKLNEHRSRRKLPPEMQSRLAELEPSFAASSRQPSASRIAARVAERYSKAPSYREMLELEAARTPARLIPHTPEDSELAANLQREAQLQAGLEPDLFKAATAADESLTEPPQARINRWAEFEPSAAPEFFSGVANLPAEPRIAQPSLAGPCAPASIEPAAQTTEPPPTLFTPAEPASLAPEPQEDSATLSLLEELATQPIEPAQPLPARIIEFPRELVAPRKARPRQERGPASELEEQQSQLRIFEVEPAAENSTPATVETPDTQSEPNLTPTPARPEWDAIRLDEQAPSTSFFDSVDVAPNQASLLLDPPIFTATIEDRLMAGLVDLCLVGVGFLMFVAAFVTCTPHLPAGKVTVLAAAGVLLTLFVLYQYLFLSFAQGTPGMRYAQIALCTFDDENPARESMRARVGAILLSALPLGLGFLWSIFDEDRLGWHDRITRTYQRSYRQN